VAPGNMSAFQKFCSSAHGEKQKPGEKGKNVKGSSGAGNILKTGIHFQNFKLYPPKIAWVLVTEKKSFKKKLLKK